LSNSNAIAAPQAKRADAVSGRRSNWRGLRGAIALVVVALAAFLLYRTLSHYESEELLASILSVRVSHLLTAIGWAAASYLCLTGFDYLALRYVDRPLPYPKVALASFVSLSMGHNIGFAALSSGAIRYRFYSREGLSAAQVAKVIVFCGATVGFGLVALAGIAILMRPGLAETVLGLSQPVLLTVAGACLAVPAVYVALAWLVRQPLHIFGWSIEMPGVKLAAAQVFIGTLNFAFVAACLHQVLNASFEVAYPTTAAVFALANSAAIVSHVPGGLGVIESVVVSLLPGSGALPLVLVFRFVYFLLPLTIGGTLFAISELWVRSGQSGERARR
jgi:hypothetical protein